MADGTIDRGNKRRAAVMERFPDKKEVIDRLFVSSQSFETLCDEYESCLTALRYWRESSLSEAPDFRNEFSSLLSELEEEILHCLSNAPSESPLKGGIRS